MRKTLVAAGVLLAALGSPALAQQKSIKIGFISTFSGPPAVIGNDMRNSFELALDHLGRKMGGLPIEVIYEDDQQKPEVGKQKTDKLIESDHVDFIAGYIWSNVLLASLKPAIDSKTIMISSNAGPSQIAGELCSPYFFSTSWQNDQTPATVGLYMNQKGVKNAYLIGPNYAAGKDMMVGVKATFKGKIVGEEYTGGQTSSISPPNFPRSAPPSPTPHSRSTRGRPVSNSSTNMFRRASKARFRSTRRSPSTRRLCRGKAKTRSASRVRSSGSTICQTTPTGSSSPTIRRSTRPRP